MAALALVATGTAHAERVALAPLESVGDLDREASRSIERLVAGGLAAVGDVDVVGARQVARALRKADRGELSRCDGSPRCLAQLGRAVEAERVVHGEIGGLGDARVVYLQVVDVRAAERQGSTTLELGGQRAPKAESRAAAVRLLAPERYRGRLDVNVDVEDARIFVNGALVARSPADPIPLPVGTQALRVTHPEYRDFVRFVEIAFDETRTLPVELTRYPVLSRDLHHRGQRGLPGDDQLGATSEDAPWYRRWYTIAGAGAVVFVGSAILVGVLADGIDADGEKVVGPE